MHGVEWPQRSRSRQDPKYDIDDNPSFQGSCWFTSKKWYEHIGKLSEDDIYAGWAQEPTEIGLKTWLGGGAVKVNKKTYYAHLHKGKQYGRGYHMNEKGVIAGHNYAAHHWVNNEEPGMAHKFAWFIDEKFPNMPTWPLDWKEKLYAKT